MNFDIRIVADVAGAREIPALVAQTSVCAPAMEFPNLQLRSIPDHQLTTRETPNGFWHHH